MRTRFFVPFFIGLLCTAFVPFALKGEPLTTALEVRSLSESQASQALQVEIEGTVLGHAEPYDRSFILVDNQGDSVYAVDLQEPYVSARTGQKVLVKGYSDPGGYAPFVAIESIDLLGDGQLPAPISVTLSDLNAGGLDSRWVETYGIVRSGRIVEELVPGGLGTQLDVAFGNERVGVQIEYPIDPETLIDAEIRFRAICVNQHNPSRQFIRPALLVPLGTEITVVRRPHQPASQSTPVPINSLLGFSPNIDFHHQVHVQGAILHSIPGEAIWIRDHTRAIKIRTKQDQPIPENSQVSVTGFLYGEAFSPGLEDASFDVTGAAAIDTTPIVLSNPEASFSHDADLIRFQAKLIEKRPQRDGIALRFEWLDADGTLTTGSMPTYGIPNIKLPPIGSVVEVTGICSVIPEEGVSVSGGLIPSHFEVYLRSTSDLALIHPPPFWNSKTILWLLLILLSVAVVTSLGIFLAARHRLNEQAHRREMAEAEFSAILNERNRLARGIHDTLAQGLGATSVQLELVRSHCSDVPKALIHHLDLAHKIVRDSLSEARTSIWNMRSQILEKSDLPDALASILKQLTDQPGLSSKSKVIGERRRLPASVENNMLRIGQEAISNATKHAKASCISLLIVFRTKEIIMVISDDGSGFDASKPAASKQSFGIVGMRERAEKIGAQLSVESNAGSGTKITLAYTG
ncbi:sensor histidine kinase [Pelagicoccus mobilis]|uniref:sensor histidine kinase n=1 Tax=Pelagicoccus mobilis TaxID=415221 RepID=UPI00366F4F12